MPDFFRSLEDVGARVRSDSTGNGKAMLGVELGMGIFDERSASLAREWVAKDDAREAAEERRRLEEWERDLKVRSLKAAERQAKAAVDATRISWMALGVAILGLVISAIALIRS